VNRRKVLSNKGSLNQLVAPRRNNNPLSRLLYIWRYYPIIFLLSDEDDLRTEIQTRNIPKTNSISNFSVEILDIQDKDWNAIANLVYLKATNTETL
jgi:hypothetical protein